MYCIQNCFPILFLWKVSLVLSHWKVPFVCVTCLAFQMGSIANSIHQNQYCCIPSSSVMLFIQFHRELVKLTNLQNKPKTTKMKLTLVIGWLSVSFPRWTGSAGAKYQTDCAGLKGAEGGCVPARVPKLQ